MKLMEKETRKTILEATGGIFSTVVDIALWEVFYLGEVGTSFSSRAAWTASYKADRLLDEINYETIKRALVNAKKRGLISYKGKWKNSIPAITQEGRRRLIAIVPHYDEKRVWDGRIYLIIYDVPETKKRDRELLREYLKRIGAGMVQESVWLTPYDPRGSLREFLDTYHLRGLVLISIMERDSSIGEEDLQSLIRRIYKLDQLNGKYREFFEKFSTGKWQSSEIYFSFLSILKNDPQLPFSLLLNDWLGEKAYKLFTQHSRHAVAY